LYSSPIQASTKPNTLLLSFSFELSLVYRCTLMNSVDTLCVVMAFCYSIMGVTLLISPKSIGLDSYWTRMDSSGEWFARAFGILICAIDLSPWYAGMDKIVLTKVYMVPNLLVLGLIAQAAFITGPVNFVVPFKMWYAPLFVSFFLLALNITVLREAYKKADSAILKEMQRAARSTQQKGKEVLNACIGKKGH
jgi:hypothetical protein